MESKHMAAEKHRAHRERIATLSEQLSGIEQSLLNEKNSSIALDREIASHAKAAASGDKGALQKQRTLHDQRAEREIQKNNLEILAAPIRAEVAKLQAEVPGLMLNEQREALGPLIANLRARAARGELLMEPALREFIAAKKECDDLLLVALPVLGRERAARIANSLGKAFSQGMRQYLSKVLSPAGFLLFGALEGGSFAAVVTPELETLQLALEADYYGDIGEAVPGRERFKCTTNISGVLGLRLKAGEIISLAVPIADPAVVKMVEIGALEQIESGKGVAA